MIYFRLVPTFALYYIRIYINNHKFFARVHRYFNNKFTGSKVTLYDTVLVEPQSLVWLVWCWWVCKELNNVGTH